MKYEEMGMFISEAQNFYSVLLDSYTLAEGINVKVGQTIRLHRDGNVVAYSVRDGDRVVEAGTIAVKD